MLPPETTLPATNTELAIASFNVENLDLTDGARFDTLAGQIVNNLAAPDIIGLQEIQDNSGPANDGIVDADVTLNRLMTAIQSAGGPSYQYRQINPLNNQDGGELGGNIRVAFLYRTDRGVSFVDRAGGDATTAVSVTLGVAGPELTVSPGRIDPTNPAFADSRKPLAGEFRVNGKPLFVIVNHLVSKGGDEPLFGRYQPPTLSSEAKRVEQARILNLFVSSILALDPAASIAVLGDLNDFQFSAPLTTLKGSQLQNLTDTLPVAERYTYIFDGNAQALDHILVSAALFARLSAYDIVHINAEYPSQASDHDPPVARFTLLNQYRLYLPYLAQAASD